MTTKKSELFHSHSSNQQFLLYKTDAKPEVKKPYEAPSFDPDNLLKFYPNILVGDAFINNAMTELDSSSKFEAMVIRIDDPAQNNISSNSHHGVELQVDVVKVIDTLCKNENGIWGQLDQNTFGCFLYKENKTSALELTQKIQRNLADLRKETISIGIASYPTVNFRKNQILDNARKALDHAFFFGPNNTISFDAVSLNISGDKLYQNGDIEGAIGEFEAAILLDPSNVNVHNSLGVCYGDLNQYDKALEEFKETIRLDPNEVMALYNAGLANMLTDKKKKALEYFLVADNKEEDVFEVALQIGKLYLDIGKPEKGKIFLEKAIKLKPESGLAFRYLGECCIAMNMTDEAISAYKQAIRKNPNDADSLSALGYLFDLEGENPEITAIFCQQSVDISPDNALFRYRLGNLYLKRTRLEDALEHFQKADDLGHDSKDLIKKIKNLMADVN